MAISLDCTRLAEWDWRVGQIFFQIFQVNSSIPSLSFGSLERLRAGDRGILLSAGSSKMLGENYKCV